MRQLHRWLLDPPASKGEKSVGKVIVGVTTLTMTLILISGLIIWIPKNRKALKNRLSVSCTKGWKRFLYDSHVSIGFYCTLLLLLMALTGLTWSFGWYREAAYSLTGDMAPQAARRLFYSLHTGSWGGMVTKILYFLAALLGGLLPLSGYWLWWKRIRRKAASTGKAESQSQSTSKV